VLGDQTGMRPGGAYRDRTGDLLLAKQVLSLLSYVPTLTASRQLGNGSGVWWAHLDLNQGPRPYQGRALTN
jgi:hypothetical protein